MKTMLRKLGQQLPFLFMGVCTYEAVFFYTRPGTHQEPLAEFFALGAVLMAVVIGLCEVVPWLRRVTGRDTGTPALDAGLWRRQSADGYLALLATQGAGGIAVIFLHATGQTFTLMVVAALLVFSKLAQMTVGALR